MLQRFLMKKMLKSQLKDMPQEQQDKLLAMIEKNPDLFTNIAKEVKAKQKEGKDQMTATMIVMQKYQDQLRKAMQEVDNA